MTPTLDSSLPAVTDYFFDKTKLQRQKVIKIFSVDGGGVRGIIPAIVTEEIEKRTNKLAFELFDVFAGASTGAILSTGLDMGFTASKVRELFENESAEVFKEPSLWYKLSTLGYITSSKYGEGKDLTTVIEKFAEGFLFKDLKKEMIVPSFEITENKPWYFRRDIAKIDPTYKDLKVVDVIRATAAAPTYYNPKPLTIGDNTYAFIDGGVFDNNPASSACRLMREDLGAHKELFVCSLGTGIYKNKIPYTGPKHWGTYFWGFDILDIFFDATSEAIDAEMRASFNSEYNSISHHNFFRFQTEVDKKRSKLDDASKKNIDYLKEKAAKLIEEKNDDLETLCHFLEKESEFEEE